MNIGIDVRTVQAHSRTGLWAYTQGMVEGLSRVDKENRYFLYGTGLRVRPKDLPLNVGRNFKKRILPVPDRDFKNKPFVLNEMAIPLSGIVDRLDVFWQPAGHRLPSRGNFRKVITIHDLRSLHIDDFLSQDIEGLKEAVKLADKVIAISEFTKRDVVEKLGAEEGKVVVIYNGADKIEKISDMRLNEPFLEKYELNDRPFIFSLGMVPRKNVKRSIEAFAKAGLTGDFYLVFAGSDGGFAGEYWALAERLGVEDDVMFLDSVTDEELRLFYSNAYIFLFPSLFEGFGLPVIEAQMCGVPVICSNSSALPEVVGDSALLVDPYSVDEIAKALNRVLLDPQLYDSLVAKGYENAKRFSWEKAAKEFLEKVL